MCYYTYRGVQGGAGGSVGEAAWETWWSGSDFSCCLYDSYNEKERDTCHQHERMAQLPCHLSRAVFVHWVSVLVAMHECVHTVAACIGAEGPDTCKRTAHCRSTAAIKRIQFPQSSIPVCLLSAEIRNEGREWGARWESGRVRENGGNKRGRREKIYMVFPENKILQKHPLFHALS